jgi:hypothetical protein
MVRARLLAWWLLWGLAVPSLAAGWPVIAVRSGTERYVDKEGFVYEPDGLATGALRTSVLKVTGTTDPALYQTERFGAGAYRWPVMNGRYRVTLRLAETFHAARAKRTFDVWAEGKAAVTAVDIFARAGAAHKAYDLRFVTTVTDGTLDVEVKARLDSPSVSAVVVEPWGSGSAALSWDPVALAKGYELRWHRLDDPDFTWVVDVGNQVRAALTGLEPGVRYGFAARTYILDPDNPGDRGYSEWTTDVVEGPAFDTLTRGPYVAGCSTQEPFPSVHHCGKALNGEQSDYWRSQWRIIPGVPPQGDEPRRLPVPPPDLPHEIVFDVGQEAAIAGLGYQPRADSPEGAIADYEVYVSRDGVHWGAAVASGTWPGTTAPQQVRFAPVTGRFVKLVNRREAGGGQATAAAEVQIYWRADVDTSTGLSVRNQ